MKSILHRFVVAVIVFLPLEAAAGNYRALQTDTHALQEKLFRNEIDRATCLVVLNQKGEDLEFSDANTFLLKRDLADAKKQEPLNLDRFVARVDALGNQENQQFHLQAVDHVRMKKILDRREFVHQTRPPVWEWVLSRIADLLKFLLGKMPDSDTVFLISRIVTVVALTALVALLGYLILRHTRSAREESSLPTLEMTTEEIQLRDPQYYRKLAEEALLKREFRLAVRHYFYAILSVLHQDGTIRYEPFRTNWEYWRMLRSNQKNPEPVRKLQQSILAYEICWYGNQSVDETAATAFRDASLFFWNQIP